MKQFPIGVITNSFKVPLDEALPLAQQAGVTGIQFYATYGDLSPQALTAQKRRELAKRIHGYGLVVTALCGDFGHGFGDPEKNDELIERSMRILELAQDLGTNIVTTHIGVVPENPAHPRYAIMQEACRHLADCADSMQAHFAVETGPERAEVLCGFLDSLGSRGVAVNFDPANLVMVTGDDPVAAVHTLGKYIVHTHAKDGIKLLDKNPEIIYGLIEEEIEAGEAFRETPIGQGNVDFRAYLRALDEVGYTGYLTIEREAGNQRFKDISESVQYLKNCMK